MTTLDAALGPPRRLGWYGWAALVLFDLAVVAVLPKALWVAAGFGALFVFGYLARRPPVACSLAVFGMPLLWPLVLVGLRADSLFIANLLLIVPLALLGWAAVWEFPDPGDGVRRLIRSLRDPVFLTALLLGIWMALRWIGTPSPVYGRGKTIQFFIVILPHLLAAMVFFGGTVGERQRAFHRFVRATLLFVLVISLLGIWNLSSQYWPSDGRLRVLGVNPIWVARLTGTTMLIVIASWSGRRMSVFLALPLLALYAVPFYSAGSRGPLLALLLALVLWWMLGGRVRVRSLVATAFAAAAGLFVLAIELGWLLNDSPLAGHDASNLSRAFYLKTVLDLGLSPGLVGIGTGGFSAAARFGDLRLYPHNLFLEIWTELGATGVGLLSAWLLLLVHRGVLAWRACPVRSGSGPGLFPTERERLRLLAALGLFGLVNAQLSGDVPANAVLWFWGGVLAVAPTAVSGGLVPSREREDRDGEGSGAGERSKNPTDPVGPPLGYP